MGFSLLKLHFSIKSAENTRSVISCNEAQIEQKQKQKMS